MCTPRSSYPPALYLLNIRDCSTFTDEDDVAAKPDLHRSLPKEDHMLQGRMIASKEFIFGSNVDATAMYDFVPTTKLKGNEEFVEKASKYFGGTMMEARRLLEPVAEDGDDENEEDEAEENSD